MSMNFDTNLLCLNKISQNSVDDRMADARLKTWGHGSYVAWNSK